MGFWGGITRRLGYLTRRSRFEQELNDEIQFHIDTLADELQQSGLSCAEAVSKARQEFGSRLRVREETRSAWQVRWLEDFFADLRYAARTLRRNRVFALTAICCLALGIGANTTMFSVAMEVLFSKPSCRDPQSLFQVRLGNGSFCPATQYRFLRDAGIFDGLGGMNIGEVVNWREGSETYRLAGTRVTDNFFAVTGVPVALGRPIMPRETNVAVLTFGFWSRRLAQDPNALGRKLVFDGKPYTVVGVLPRDHRNLAGFGFMPDLYLTLDSSEYLLFARLPQGTHRAEAQARLQATARELDRVFPNPDHKWAAGTAVSAVGGIERLAADGDMAAGGLVPIIAFFAMLLIVTGLVLLIACANVSSLLLARAFTRSRELAIRASLGGSRGRVTRQLLTESLLLAACGTSAGLLINLWLTTLLSRFRLPSPLPIELHIQPDWRLLGYSITIALVVTLATGLVPAVRGTRAGINAAFKEPERYFGNTRWTLRNLLVVAQLAVSIVLLSGGMLFLRNLLHATSLNTGFDTTRTIWATFRAVPESYTPEQFTALARTAVERVGALPGVEAASLARAVPLQSPFRPDGELRADTGDRAVHARYNFNAVGPDYFRVMQIPVLRGRAFADSDRSQSAAVVILNENMARLLFGDADPIGHTLLLPENRRVRVVGLVRNSKYFILGEENPLAVYLSYDQYHDGAPFAHMLVRARRTPDDILQSVNRTLGDLDPAVAAETRAMRDALQYALLPSQVGAAVLGTTALLGLALAAVGLYGVLLYAVTRRIREIGVRMALGATPANILAMIAGESVRLVAAGAAIGLAIALVAVRPLSMFLVPEVKPTDATNFVAVACVLSLIAALATLSPAIHGLRVDPADALRHE